MAVVSPLSLRSKLREAILACRRYSVVLLIVVLGTAASVGAYVLIERAEQRIAEDSFNQVAALQIESVKQTIDKDIQVLRSIKSLYDASVEVSREEFGSFVSQTLETNSSIQALEWIPLVPGPELQAFESQARLQGLTQFVVSEREPDGTLGPVGERDEYFPVFFLEPLLGNESALGFDLGSNASRLAALTMARDTGKPVATEGITLVQADEGEPGFLMFEAVYKNNTSIQSVADRRSNLEGFALAVFRINVMIENALATPDGSEGPREFDITVVDRSQDGGQLLYPTNAALPLPDDRGAFYEESELAVAERTWLIAITPNSLYSTGKSVWQQWSALAGGLAMTFLLATFTLATLRGRLVTETIVAYRTAELNASHDSLEQQIQERVLIEESLRASEQRIRAILDASVDAVISIDRIGTIQTFNPAAETMFGYQTSEVIGQNVNILMPEPFHGEHDGYLARYASGGEPRIIGIGREVVGKRKDGTTFPMDLSVGESGTEQDKVYIGTVRDITELKRAEFELQEMAKFPSENPNAVLRVTDVGSIIYSNHYAEDLLAHWSTAVGGHIPPDIHSLVRTAISNSAPQEELVELNGRLIALEITPVAETNYANLYGRDVTERVSLEREVAEYTSSLEAAYKDLQQLDALKDGFLSTVSHELRTPLTSIKGFAEILLSYEDMDNETVKEFITIINEESDRLTRLVTDVLDLAKIEAQRMEWSDSEVDVADVIRAVIANTQSLAMQAAVSVGIEVDADLPSVFVDRDRLTQVITNLISNSIKFTPPNGSIRIIGQGAESGGSSSVLIRIVDSGIGIGPDQIATVFDKFQQVGDTLTDRPTGTGLGLPICKEIVEHYGGEIWAESQPGLGSSFSFTLPAFPQNAGPTR